MKISLLCPTRKRPAQMERLWMSVLDTALDCANIELIFYIDKDDKDSKEKYQDLKLRYEGQIFAVVGERDRILSKMWNRCHEIATGEILHHCGDDIVFASTNWDFHVRQAFEECPDRILFVYGKDGVQNERLGTHGFIHQNWVKTVGYFVPPYFSCWYNDTWLTNVSKRIDRARYIPEIYTRHIRSVRQGAVNDDTYKDRQKMGREDHMKELWKSMEPKRLEDACKLMKFIQEFDKQKALRV